MTTDERILEKGKIPAGGVHGGDGSRAAEGDIAFGCGVCLGTDKETQVKLFASGCVFWGVAVYDPTKGYVPDGSGNMVTERRYHDGDAVSVLRRGPIVVEVEEEVEAGDPVYVSHTTGNFYKQAGAGQTLVAGAKFNTSASGDGELAEIELNLP